MSLLFICHFFPSFILCGLGVRWKISEDDGSEDKKEGSGLQADFLREGAARGTYREKFVVLLLVVRSFTFIIFKQQNSHKAKSLELWTSDLPVW